MPGLFGAFGGEIDALQCLASVSDVQALDSVEVFERRCVWDNFCFASYAVTADVDPVGRLAGSDAVLLLEGEVFNVSQPASRTGAPTVSELLLERYLDRGPRFIDELDGEFNIAVYEPSLRRVSVFNDHIGSYPMYYCRSSRALAFGSEKKFLLAAGIAAQRLDAVGILQPFVHRHNLEDRTFIESIRRLPPASMIRVVDGQLTVAASGLAWPSGQPPGRTDELIEAWTHRLYDATAKRVRGKRRIGISLSGGLDSRAVACSIERNARPIWARTMGVLGSREVVVATSIAKALKFDHVVEDISQLAPSSAVHRIVWRTEGETPFHDGLSTLTHNRTKEECDHLIGGWLGDVSSGGHIRPFMMLPVSRARLIEKIFDWYVGYAGTNFHLVFSKDFLRKNLPAVRQEFLDSYTRFSSWDGPTAHELWDLRNRQSRMTISSMPADSHLFGKVRPFFDRAYLSFAMSVPVRWRIAQSLYKSLIYAIGPEIRHVPNGNDDVLLRRSPVANLGGAVVSVGSKVSAKVVSRLGTRFSRSPQPTFGPGFASQTRRDEGLRSIVESFIQSAAFDENVFSASGIRSVLNQHYSGERDHSNLLSSLVTWAVAIQFFVAGRVQRCPQSAQPQLR